MGGWVMGFSPGLKSVHRTLFYLPFGQAGLFEPHHPECPYKKESSKSYSLFYGVGDGILPRPKKVSTGHFFTCPLGRSASSNPIAPNTHIKKRVAKATLFFMGWVMGFEPTNTGTTIRCLRPLGDTHHIYF